MPKTNPSDTVLTSTERLEAIVAETDFDPSTLAGDIRDVLLDLFKSRPKPWSQLTEGEQQDVARALEYASRDAVTKAVDAIRSTGTSTPVRAILESYTEKDGIKASLKVKTNDDQDASEAVLALHRARGKLVHVTIASSDDYMGERNGVDIDPDESGLDFEGGAQVPAEDDES